ncbi:MAG: universal stress protein [Clostridia bacterium]|nr:universal stress protein [Clostridia bacterium]
MTVVQRIALGFDGSENALRAVRTVADLARQLGARVLVVHVVAPVPAEVRAELAGMDLNLDAIVERNGQETLRPAAEILAAAGVPYETRVAVGLAAEELVAAAAEWEADLLAVGRRGRGFVGELFLGSVSHGVIHRARCPVLVVQ